MNYMIDFQINLNVIQIQYYVTFFNAAWCQKV